MSPKSNKLCIVMVGLPARGKSTIAIRLKETFVNSSINARIFNNGTLRKKRLPGKDTCYATFFDPENKPAVDLRAKFAMTNIKKARHYLADKGQVAILDATNVSNARRALIEEQMKDYPVLYIECVNTDKEILYLGMMQKLDSTEFQSLTKEEASKEFIKRIHFYEQIYAPLLEEKNFIRMDSLHNCILEEKISTGLPLYSRIRDILVTDMVKDLFLIRHTETLFNVADRIGGDSSLTTRGEEQALALARFFQKKSVSYIFTSEKNRTIQTANPICHAQDNCTIVPLKEFNEIDGGICEGMSYEEIQQSMPEVYFSRKTDKYNYVYPKGEGYISMRSRIRVGIKKAFYLNRSSNSIMIIGHRAVNRMILSHFLYRRDNDVPYIYVPQ
ncbi:MAG: 6-phosphofructo-2-kinase/fructose-2,6-bisphosphatase, partial [Thermodesulfobacteriota bacterium]|nr:6-phosphofructo-2-kinase/fructose-2,6-bisphosphatase [Thermodesulfobacteriota bacterium]